MRTPKRQGESFEAAAAVTVGMTEGRGRGLFAARAMTAGATALTERPLVGMQSVDNAQNVTVCRNCLGFAGDVISQLEVLSGVPRQDCLEGYLKRKPTRGGDKAEQRGQLSGLYCCLEGCGEVYCSARCRSEHWSRSHRLLCVGPVPEEGAQDHPLIKFRVHAMQTNEIFLLVGEVLAQIAVAFSKDPSTTNAADSNVDSEKLAAARAPFADFVQEPWWDVAVPRDAVDAAPGTAGAASASASAASLPDTLRALCEESSALLRSAFALALGPLPAPLEQALSAERFARVVGMFEQNNMGVRAPSPIPGALREFLGEGKERSVSDVKHDASRRQILRETADLVLEVFDEAHCVVVDDEEEEDDDEEEDNDVEEEDDDEEDTMCCGGQEEGEESDGDGGSCCTSTPGGEAPDSDEEEDAGEVVSKCCGGQPEGEEDDGDGGSCTSAQTGEASGSGEVVLEAAHKMGSTAAASGGCCEDEVPGEKRTKCRGGRENGGELAYTTDTAARAAATLDVDSADEDEDDRDECEDDTDEDEDGTEEDEDDTEDEDDNLEVLRDAVDRHDGDEAEPGEEPFAPLDGTALYSLVCCMNHSCRPNCVVLYPGRRKQRQLRGKDPAGHDADDGGGEMADPLVAEVVLLEDVRAGDELTQSYVSKEMSLEERRKALEDYGFLCACPRCLEEEAAALL
eukprot:g10245.t1